MAKDEKNKKNNNQKNSFLKDSKAELKKVNWPTPKRLANDTATVIGIVLVVAAIVFVLDLAFLTLKAQIILQ
jgi:preprotein translocase SecE subunit